SGCSAGRTSIAPYSTSIWSKTWTTRIEKPQRGMSGVPFMNSSTGLAAISSSTLDFSSGSAMGGIVGRAVRRPSSDLGCDQADDRGQNRYERREEAAAHEQDRVLEVVDPAAELAHATVQVVESGVGPGRAHAPHASKRREKSHTCGRRKCNFLSARRLA